jgi:hypothetical protein
MAQSLTTLACDRLNFEKFGSIKDDVDTATRVRVDEE